jgi:membrane protein implicated in regulation of membrane protease activity
MMTALLGIWWVWVALALVLALIEVMAPGFIFLGFALGALAISAIVGLGYASSVPVLMVLFAGVSLLAWIALRLVFRKQSSGARIITRDVNDD